MGDIVKTSKKTKISGVIIKPDNIREIARKAYDEYKSGKKESHRDINFILRGINGTQYKSEGIQFLSEGGTLDTRRIIAIEITYCNFTEEKRISIKLKHVIKDYDEWENAIYVSGPNELWVNGVIRYFEDTIANWEKQANWPHKCDWFLAIIFATILAVCIGLLCFKILNFNFLFTYMHLISPDSPLLFGLLFGIGIGFGRLAGYISNKLEELYPIVELRTGPEYTQLEAKKRKKLFAVISIGIIPLIILLIIELIKIIIG